MSISHSTVCAHTHIINGVGGAPFGNREGTGKCQGWPVSGRYTDNQGDNAATTSVQGILGAAFKMRLCGNAALCSPVFPGHQGLEFLGIWSWGPGGLGTFLAPVFQLSGPAWNTVSARPVRGEGRRLELVDLGSHTASDKSHAPTRTRNAWISSWQPPTTTHELLQQGTISSSSCCCSSLPATRVLLQPVSISSSSCCRCCSARSSPSRALGRPH